MPIPRTFLILTYESDYCSWVNGRYGCYCDEDSDKLCDQCKLERDSYTNKVLVVSSDYSVLESVIVKEVETLLKSNDAFKDELVRDLYADVDGDDFRGHGDDSEAIPYPSAKTNAPRHLRATYNFLRGHKWETKSTAFDMLTAKKGEKKDYIMHTFTLKLKKITEPCFKEELIAKTCTLVE